MIEIDSKWKEITAEFENGGERGLVTYPVLQLIFVDIADEVRWLSNGFQNVFLLVGQHVFLFPSATSCVPVKMKAVKIQNNIR